MLYRPSRSEASVSAVSRFFGLARRLMSGRRRADIRELSPYLRADLGVDDRSLPFRHLR